MKKELPLIPRRPLIVLVKQVTCCLKQFRKAKVMTFQTDGHKTDSDEQVL